MTQIDGGGSCGSSDVFIEWPALESWTNQPTYGVGAATSALHVPDSLASGKFAMTNNLGGQPGECVSILSIVGSERDESLADFCRHAVDLHSAAVKQA